MAATIPFPLAGAGHVVLAAWVLAAAEQFLGARVLMTYLRPSNLA